MTTRTRQLTIAVLGLAALALGACGGGGSASEGASEDATNADSPKGVLEVEAGACTGPAPTGSWFRMIQPGGKPGSGPFVTNGDSSCTDKGVTPLSAGTDGGLRVGDYQPQPDPPFGDGGASKSAAVIAPATFFAVPFGMSTNPTDPQTGEKVPAPSVTIDGSKLRANLSAVSVSWNGQHFNQGAPKPGAKTGEATGTFDEATHRYTLEWTSLIKGGPFNGFTGVWHLEGTFRST